MVAWILVLQGPSPSATPTLTTLEIHGCLDRPWPWWLTRGFETRGCLDIRPIPTGNSWRASTLVERPVSVDFTGPGTLDTGQFRAIEYFCEGSLHPPYAPDYAVGRLCGLAWVTSSASLIMMGADAANHGGEMRPTVPLPLSDLHLAKPIPALVGNTLTGPHHLPTCPIK